MHTSLILSSILLVFIGGSLALSFLPRLDSWLWRRDLQVWVLGIPVIALGLAMGALHHFLNRDCFVNAPTWDYVIGVVLPVGMAVIALGGAVVGLLRLLLMHWVITHRGVQAGTALQALADQQAEQLGASRPRVLLCAFNRPLALAYGLWRPTVLLSTWMVEHLDQRELEAVLAHEIGHIARRDYLVICLASVLRDAFFYLPTSWRAYHRLQHEKELACDDLAVSVTKRPLALASALAKVWQQTVSGPSLGLAQSLIGVNELMEDRIERLLTTPQISEIELRPRSAVLGFMSSAVIILLLLEAINLAVMLAPMGCGPASLLGRLL